jgi:hypothetical protein
MSGKGTLGQHRSIQYFNSWPGFIGEYWLHSWPDRLYAKLKGLYSILKKMGSHWEY